MSPAKSLFALVRERVRVATAAVAAQCQLPPGLDLTDVIEAPRDPARGDMTTNAAMVLARHGGRRPRELATMIAGRIAIDALVARVDIAGPGFINLTLTFEAFSRELRALLAAGAAHGRANVDPGTEVEVTVAHLCADPVTPMQANEGRAAVFADALARLLGCAGYTVTRDCRLDDDAGRQTIVVLSSGPGNDAGGRQLAAKAAGATRRETKVVQPVRLLRAGRPVPGEPAGSCDVVDDVDRDALRFMMLWRRHDALLDVDLVCATEQTRDNPVFWIQYGHARGHSVLRHARGIFPDLPEDPRERALMLADMPLERLDGRAESSLMRRMAFYPHIIESAAAAREPHRIALYLHELASEFHTLWTEGKDSPHLRFIIQDDPQLTLARLALVQGIVTVLAAGLSMLGVGAPEEMR